MKYVNKLILDIEFLCPICRTNLEDKISMNNTDMTLDNFSREYKCFNCGLNSIIELNINFQMIPSLPNKGYK